MSHPTSLAPTPVLGILATDRHHIPASHLDLVECPPVAALTTVMPDGCPQTSVVWCDYEGEFVRVNTMRGFQKERNMRRNPRVTLLCYDPNDDGRCLEVRGTVDEMTEEGAVAHLDALTSKYAGRPMRYFGECVPAALAETAVPVLCRIRPTYVVALDARRCAEVRP
jgi:PPOX class probable F420-dependent enzyme